MIRTTPVSLKIGGIPKEPFTSGAEMECEAYLGLQAERSKALKCHLCSSCPYVPDGYIHLTWVKMVK